MSSKNLSYRERKPPSIFLIGFRGSGKSTLGKLLSQKLSLDFYDTDWEIQDKQGLSTNAFLKQHGESAFRRVEEEVLSGILRKKAPMVLATGGGLVLSENNRGLLKTNGILVYLFASLEILVERLSQESRTPLTSLSLREEISFLMKEREPIYQELAHIEIDTGKDSPNRCIDQILNFLIAKDEKG